jgi:hypothetical protein
MPLPRNIGILADFRRQSVFPGRQLVILALQGLFSRQNVLGRFVGHLVGNGQVRCAGDSGDQDSHPP